jgi:hypothetical protein
MRPQNLDASWPPSPTSDTDGEGEESMSTAAEVLGTLPKSLGQIDK